ncbi:MAG: JAB domain-containing protein [Candidatus Portiera sp.]|nr:JAB domain-containing protein [Portiera sp.]
MHSFIRLFNNDFLSQPLIAKRKEIWRNKEDAPREKLMKKGVEFLSDSELLAIFLRVGYKGKNVMELAQDVIATKGLSWLLTANSKEFCDYKGLGPSHYVQLRAVMELARRYLEEVMLRQSESLNSPTKIKNFLCHRLGDSTREVFACLFMDNKNRVIEYKELFSGTIDSANVYPREIIRHALQVNAAGLVVVHNHPSGSVKPSVADKHITGVIKDACELMEIRLLDHIIVSGNKSLSFLEDGLL